MVLEDVQGQRHCAALAVDYALGRQRPAAGKHQIHVALIQWHVLEDNQAEPLARGQRLLQGLHLGQPVEHVHVREGDRALVREQVATTKIRSALR